MNEEMKEKVSSFIEGIKRLENSCSDTSTFEKNLFQKNYQISLILFCQDALLSHLK